jgi:flagellar protein FliO/FliZ
VGSLLTFGTIGAAELQTLPSVNWLDYARVMLVLGGILIVGFLVVRYWLPRMTGGLTNPSGGAVQILARFPLEPRKTLYVVKAGHMIMLLASSEAGVQFMTALDPDDFSEVAVKSRRDSGVSEPRFLNLLNSINKRKSS